MQTGTWVNGNARRSVIWEVLCQGSHNSCSSSKSCRRAFRWTSQLLRSHWGRIALSVGCNEVQLLPRALHFPLLISHGCRPARQEYTTLGWPTGQHPHHIQGSGTLTLPCPIPISHLQLGGGWSICPCPQSSHLLAHEFCAIKTRSTLSLQRECAGEGGGNVQAQPKPTGICEQQQQQESQGQNLWLKTPPLTYGERFALYMANQWPSTECYRLRKEEQTTDQ